MSKNFYIHQEQDFIRCRGRMGVPVSAMDKLGCPVEGTFWRNDGTTIDHAFALTNKNDGRTSYYEIIDQLGDAEINGRKIYKRILIWEVFPRLLTEAEWIEHMHRVCGGGGKNE